LRTRPLKPPLWRRLFGWIWASTRVQIVTVLTLGMLFLLTAKLGSVAKDGIDAFYSVYTIKSGPSDHLSAVVHVSTLGEIIPIEACGVIAPQMLHQTIGVDHVHLVNWFGENMRGVLDLIEWIVGLVYDVHLPSSVQGLAEQVQSPNFGQQPIRLLFLDASRSETSEFVNRALNDSACSSEVGALLGRHEAVCEINRLFWSPEAGKIVGAGVLQKCIVPASATSGAYAPAHHRPFLTKVKMLLGLLIQRVDDEVGNGRSSTTPVN
jgi:hypothetical protein